MARFPSFSVAADALPASIFARLYDRLATYKGEVFPFQIGDTHLAPPDPGRLGALAFGNDADPALYAYSPPTGCADLVGAVIEKVRRQNAFTEASAENIQITCGATHGLSCSIRALLDPGDEMLLLAPYWPLIRGIALSSTIRPVEVPFSHRILREPGVDIEALLERQITGRTAALYICSPNNPDGLVLDRPSLEAVARVAIRHHLWVLSDEVYEDFVYDDKRHLSIGSLPGMAERTVTVFSFSKSFAQAGLRLGYAVGPKHAIGAIRKMVNHTVYSVPKALQRAATGALSQSEVFLSEARAKYRAARDLAHEQVMVPSIRPDGATYLFLDIGSFVGQDLACCLDVLEELAAAGVLLAPGSAFGTPYGRFARMCFTAVDGDRLGEGIARMNEVFARLKPA